MGIEFTFRKQDTTKGGTGVALPEGLYDLQVESVEETSSKKGNPQLRVNCVICSGDKDGRKVVLWLSLMEQSLWKLQTLLEAVGIATEGEEIKFDTDDLIGRRFQSRNEPREYEGQMRDDWQNFGPSALDAGSPADREIPDGATMRRSRSLG